MRRNNLKVKCHCGLCNKMVEDWHKHKISKDHLKNLNDPLKIIESVENHNKAMERVIKFKRGE